MPIISARAHEHTHRDRGREGEGGRQRGEERERGEEIVYVSLSSAERSRAGSLARSIPECCPASFVAGGPVFSGCPVCLAGRFLRLCLVT